MSTVFNCWVIPQKENTRCNLMFFTVFEMKISIVNYRWSRPPPRVMKKSCTNNSNLEVFRFLDKEDFNRWLKKIKLFEVLSSLVQPLLYGLYYFFGYLEFLSSDKLPRKFFWLRALFSFNGMFFLNTFLLYLKYETVYYRNVFCYWVWTWKPSKLSYNFR